MKNKEVETEFVTIRSDDEVWFESVSLVSQVRKIASERTGDIQAAMTGLADMLERVAAKAQKKSGTF